MIAGREKKALFASLAGVAIPAAYHALNLRDAFLANGDALLWKLYALLAAVSLAGAGLLGCAYLRRKLPMHRLFFATGLFLGAVYMAVMPGLSAPDEMSHYSSAYRLSSRLMGKPELTYPAGLLAVRERDYPLEDLDGVKTPEIPEDREELPRVLGNPVLNQTYRTALEWSRRYPGGDREVSSALPDVRTTPVMYFPQALGFSLARAAGGGTMALLFLGKFCNLAVYLLLVSAAIYIAPCGKELIFGAALLPMSLHLAASLSYDAGIIGTVFLYVAGLLSLRFRKRRLRGRELLLLCLLAAAYGPCKMIYLPLIFLFLLVPGGVCGGKRKKALCFSAILISALLAALLVNGKIVRGYLSPAAGRAEAVRETEEAWETDAAREPEEVGEANAGAERGGAEQAAPSPVSGRGEYTAAELLRRPVFVLRMTADTFSLQGAELLSGVVGAKLGNLDPLLGAPCFVVCLYWLGLLCMAAGDGSGRAALSGAEKTAAAAALLCVPLLAAGAMLLAWTTRASTVIEGIQGRYFIPLLPPALFLLRGKRARVQGLRREEILLLFVVMNLYVALRIFALASLRV